jgi:hypothetical protein
MNEVMKERNYLHLKILTWALPPERASGPETCSFSKLADIHSLSPRALKNFQTHLILFILFPHSFPVKPQ